MWSRARKADANHLIQSLLAKVGSLTWSVAVLSAAVIGVESAVAAVPLNNNTAPATSIAPAQTRGTPQIIRIADGPGANQITIQMDRPFADYHAQMIGQRVGS